MNAKMMHVYEASPYTHAAWDFPQEPWLSFMMNIHTTTPYGYVWTGLGYVLYILALGDLQLGMMLFRLLAVFSVAAIGWSIWEISAKDRRMLFAGYFMFNPLVMLEAINNTHNDITMMAFLLVGLALFFRYRQKNKLQASILLLVGWLLSVHTKLVTVVLPAVVALYYVLRKKIPWFNAADYGAWLLIVAMFADGSKRFFSWYLLWAFSLSALAQSKFTKQILFLFSFTGMLSYVFFISSGEYSKEQGLLRIGLLFSLPIIFVIYAALFQLKLRLLGNDHD
jgi:4-amino-4-deoxy-L-arabinose transferase-like glycosyltransferase